MAEDEKTASGAVPRLVQEFTAQLGAITGRLEELAGLGGGNPLTPGTLPLPGGLSAAQMTSIAGSIAAQRRSPPDTQVLYGSEPLQTTIVSGPGASRHHRFRRHSPHSPRSVREEESSRRSRGSATLDFGPLHSICRGC